MGVILDLNKEEINALKLAIESLRHVRKEFHTFNANMYEIFGAENQKKHYDKKVKYDEAIEILENLLKGENT